MKQVLKVVGEVGKKYGTCIVSEAGESFEITTFRRDIGSVNHRKPAEVIFTDSLEEDALRRDFTCNAIYFNPKTETYIDPTGGIQDIQKGILRFVGNPRERIEEDVLRILRYIRFKNRYNFQLADENYWEIFQNSTPLLKNLPIERIRQELDGILLLDNNVQALDDLKKIGFLKLFLPELEVLESCLGNKHHQEGDVWIHTKMCLQEMNHILKRENIEHEDEKLLLLWAILLHDIGKAPTFSRGEDGEAHYYDHERIGAEMFLQDIAPRLKFSNTFQDTIYFLIEEHLRLFKIPQMRKLKTRTLMMHPYFPLLLKLGEADNRGRIPTKEEAFAHIGEIYQKFQTLLETKRFLTGDDVMERYPDLEGREIGDKLKALNDQILIEG